MALEDDIATLSRAPLFSLMDYDALRLVAFAGEHRALGSGDMLFRKGDTSDGGFVVTKGAVALEPEPGHEAFLAGPARSSARRRCSAARFGAAPRSRARPPRCSGSRRR